MVLNLPFPPHPAHAAHFADLTVNSVRSIDGHELDYSIDSLEVIDAIVCRFRDPGLMEEQIAETLFMFGCYLGEVVARETGGHWMMPEASGLPQEALPYFPFMVVRQNSGHVTNPICKLFKLFENGMVDSTVYFAKVFSAPAEQKT